MNTKRYLMSDLVPSLSAWTNQNPSTQVVWGPLHRRMNRVFDDLLSGFELGSMAANVDKSAAFTPRISVHEDAQAYTVKAELPDIDEKNLDISITKEGLTIRGEKNNEHEHKEGESFYSERVFGSFTRHIPLATEVNEDKVEATFSKGVLTITLPKITMEQKGAKKISVRAA